MAPFLGNTAAKVEPSADNDQKLCPSGKLCSSMSHPWPGGHRSSAHPAGLPAGLRKSTSDSVIAGPGSVLEVEILRKAERGREYRERLRQTSGSCGPPSAWADTVQTLRADSRPSSSSRSVRPAGKRSMGLSAGSMPSRPITTGSMEGALEGPRLEAGRKSRSAGALEGGLEGTYNCAKHTWAHPLARAEAKRLASNTEEQGSWAWTMFKARDHLGYDGVVDRRDVQSTAVSEDGPQWFVGTRTLPGPLSTKKVPVRRCPFVEIEGKELKVRARTYQRGNDLSCTATLHARPTPPAPMKRPTSRGSHENHAARRCNLEWGGCQVAAQA